ncbi:hypothetical protein ACL02S_05410 [Nocardia sp. 004]|uniref:hypothetical protein n=1 Tax=Nocardia sp. 004 TaxID=3385978 RepID=UPI0039A04214
MTDVETGTSIDPAALAADPMVAGPGFATVSTPLRRVAGQLRAVLPPGWRLEIVEAPPRQSGGRGPILRAVMPTD